MKLEPAFARALDGDLPRDLDADAPRRARPPRAAARPVRAPGEVHRRPVAVGNGAQERPLSGEASGRHAGERTPHDERTAIIAFERSGHETSLRAQIAGR